MTRLAEIEARLDSANSVEAEARASGGRYEIDAVTMLDLSIANRADLRWLLDVAKAAEWLLTQAISYESEARERGVWRDSDADAIIVVSIQAKLAAALNPKPESEDARWATKRGQVLLGSVLTTRRKRCARR